MKKWVTVPILVFLIGVVLGSVGSKFVLNHTEAATLTRVSWWRQVEVYRFDSYTVVERSSESPPANAENIEEETNLNSSKGLMLGNIALGLETVYTYRLPNATSIEQVSVGESNSSPYWPVLGTVYAPMCAGPEFTPGCFFEAHTETYSVVFEANGQEYGLELTYDQWVSLEVGASYLLKIRNDTVVEYERAP